MSTAAATAAKTASPALIDEISQKLNDQLDQSIERIFHLNAETKVIAINAKMESARAGGSSGKAFGVVAESIQQVSQQTAVIAEQLAKQANSTLKQLRAVNNELATNVRGERLANLAFANIDLIDRNLYERSCDVRWWATDPSVVNCLHNPTEENCRYASRRLGQILDSYTVYFDIVVADTTGKVITNGRPNQFRSVGSKHIISDWFQSALMTNSGTEFGFQSVTNSELSGGQRSLIYSCTIREEGDPQGKILGVLGIVFHWDELAQVIVRQTPLSAEEMSKARICITDGSGLILADTEESFLQNLSLPELGQILVSGLSHRLVTINNRTLCVAHAHSRGFETYSTGWHSLIIETID